MNLFATVLTYAAPSANYRGESANNRAVIQKITRGRHEYPIISPEAIRNALRETLRALGLPCNRTRLDDEEQLAVEFQDYPDADAYADDFFMGWLLAVNNRDKVLKELKEKNRKPGSFTFKRDSILRMNMAVALEQYRHDSVFTQSPQNAGNSPWQNAKNSQLLHRETAYTAFQFPFALNLNDCVCKQDGCLHSDPPSKKSDICKQYWTRTFLKAIGQLNDVAGNHARSYFEMAPASIVVRITERLACGYESYGFRVGEDGKHSFPKVVEGIIHGEKPENADYQGNEFFLGGELVKGLDAETESALKKRGVILDRSPQRLLETVAERAFPKIA